MSLAQHCLEKAQGAKRVQGIRYESVPADLLARKGVPV
jgi:hypothetical protein